MRLVKLALEPLSQDAFAPFGQVIAKTSSPPVFTGTSLESWPFDFSIDGTVELMLNRFHYRDIEFTMIERHFHVTQTFLPLGGMPMAMVVAAPTDPADWSAIPRPEDLHAFYVDGTQGIMMWRGTWHALHRFPVRPPHVDIGLITEAETQHELEVDREGGGAPKRTQAVDLKSVEGVRFRVVDPENLMGSD